MLISLPFAFLSSSFYFFFLNFDLYLVYYEDPTSLYFMTVLFFKTFYFVLEYSQLTMC